MANQELLTKLNDALNREVSTFLRYMLQGASIKGAEWEPVRQMYLAEVADEVDARTRSLVAQFRLSGTVSFDLSAGRIIGTDYAIRDEVTGFAGDDSRMTVTGRLRQNIQLPVARRQP